MPSGHGDVRGGFGIRPGVILAGLGAAFGLLTRLPMWRVLPAGADGRDGVWAYAPVGGVIGLLGGGVYAGLAWTGMPPALAASWTVAAGLLITGGLHEDGLADMADGFGGGATRERKLAIMRDSRIGSYGASALVLALGLRGAAIAVLGDPSRVLVALVVAGAFARAAMVLVLAITPPARVDGLAAGLVRVSWRLAVGSAGFCLVLATVLVPWRVAVASLAVMAGVAMGLRWLALRQVGGHSGDVLGAIALVTECALLSLLARGW